MSSRKLPWGPFIVRVVVLIYALVRAGSFVVDPGFQRQFPMLGDVLGYLLVMSPMFVIWLWLQYFGVRSEHPLGIEGSRILHVKGRLVHRTWNPLELGSSRLDAEGELESGVTLSLKMVHHVPWFWPSHVRAIARFGVPNREVVGYCTRHLMSSVVCPPGMRMRVQPFWLESLRRLSVIPHWKVILTPTYIQVWGLNCKGANDLVKVLGSVLQAWNELMPPSPRGYRDARSPSVSADDVAAFERMADTEWAAFPRQPKGLEHG